MGEINDIHRDYPEFRREASLYLEAHGYYLIEDLHGKIIYKNLNDLYVTVVNQRFDPPEIWIGLKPGINNIALGWILELYLTGGTALSNAQTTQIQSGKATTYCQYYLKLLETYYSILLDLVHNQEPYREWQRQNSTNMANLVKEETKAKDKTS